MVNIKVSGVTTAKQLQQLDGLNVGFAGLDFNAGSPRNAAKTTDSAEVSRLDLDVRLVGIFENMSFEDITAVAGKFSLDLVQLHGEADAELCADLNDEGLEVIQTFQVDETTNIDRLIKDYDDVCDYYLFEGAKAASGSAERKALVWKKIKESRIEKPFFISGGITPEDAAVIKKFRHPDFYGIDLGSEFEKDPGVIDMALLLGFLRNLK